jgi:tetratricopeptide (TPR) repeat protein
MKTQFAGLHIGLMIKHKKTSKSWMITDFVTSFSSVKKQIADEYSMTKTGSLAHYYAGICNLRTGKFEQAIEHLQNYNGNDEMVSSIAVGAIGDCNMELNRVDEAIKFYLKAADKSSNSFTTPLYLKKAGFAYEQKSNFSEALALYERIKKEYGKSNEGREIDRDIAKVKVLIEMFILNEKKIILVYEKNNIF